MGETAVHALKILVLFFVSISLVGAGMWTYYALQLVVGAAGLFVGFAVLLYAGYDTYRLASAV